MPKPPDYDTMSEKGSTTSKGFFGFGGSAEPEPEPEPIIETPKENTGLLGKSKDVMQQAGSKLKATGDAIKDGTEKGYKAAKERIIAIQQDPELKEKADKFKRWSKDGPAALKLVCAVSNIFCCVIAVGEILKHWIAREEEEHTFSTIVVACYALFFSFCGLMVEGSSLTWIGQFKFGRKFKSRMDHHCRFLQRVWGRGFLYLFIGFVQWGMYTFWSAIAGISMFVCAVLCFITSYLMAKRMNALTSELLKGYQQDMASGEFQKKYQKIDEEKRAYLKKTFDKMDADKSGFLDKSELGVVCKELGCEFSNEELNAIFMVLDEDGNGELSFDEFANWWFGTRAVNFSLI